MGVAAVIVGGLEGGVERWCADRRNVELDDGMFGVLDSVYAGVLSRGGQSTRSQVIV